MYLKFVHPVHDIDKMSILNFFDFTSLTGLQGVQKVFKTTIKNCILSKLFKYTQITSNGCILDFHLKTVIFFNLQQIKFYQYFIIVVYWIG